MCIHIFIRYISTVSKITVNDYFIIWAFINVNLGFNFKDGPCIFGVLFLLKGLKSFKILKIFKIFSCIFSPVSSPHTGLVLHVFFLDL